MIDHRPEHLCKALRGADLVLHMIEALKYREIAVRIGLHHVFPILEMILDASEFPEGALLQLLRERRERPVLQTVRQLTAEIFTGQIFARLNEIGLDLLIIAPEDGLTVIRN